MLRSRLFSTFTVIGALLIVLGIVGLVLGRSFVFDPGQRATGYEAWYYLAIGVLMLLNGLLTPAPPEEANTPKSPRYPISAQPSREPAVTTADQTAE